MNIVKISSWHKLRNSKKIRFYFENIFNLPQYKIFLSNIYFFNEFENIIIHFNKKLYILIKTSLYNNLNETISAILSFDKFKLIDSIIIKHYYETFNLSGLDDYVIRNYKTMYTNIDKHTNNDSMKYSNYCIDRLNHLDEKDIDLRIFLQNNIFNNKNLYRKPIDKQYIFREINHDSFMNDYCYSFKFNNIPIGYGQIIKEKEKYYLVNFGILPEYRGNGYGKIFINLILNDLFDIGEINQLYLNVDNNNFSAINLYKSAGFKSIINTVQIKLS